MRLCVERGPETGTRGPNGSCETRGLPDAPGAGARVRLQGRRTEPGRAAGLRETDGEPACAAGAGGPNKGDDT